MTVALTSEEEQQIVAELRRGAGWRSIAKRFHRCGSTIRAIAAKAGIPPKRKIWTAEDEAYLRKAYADGITRELAEHLGRPIGQVYQKAKSLGLEKTAEYLQKYAQAQPGVRLSRTTEFPKGHIPANKGLRRPGWHRGRMRETQFKKGTRSGRAAENYQPIGAERISKDGYLERKINDAMPFQRRWRAVHLLVWEEAHGPLPRGYAIAFKNGNKRDVGLENLELISRADLMRRNTIHHLPESLKEVIQLKGRLKRVIGTREKRHAQKQA